MSIYNLGRKRRCQYAFFINANIAIFFVAYESACVLMSKSVYGVIMKYFLPFHNRAQNLSCCIFVPSVSPRHFLTVSMAGPFRGVPEFSSMI